MAEDSARGGRSIEGRVVKAVNDKTRVVAVDRDVVIPRRLGRVPAPVVLGQVGQAVMIAVVVGRDLAERPEVPPLPPVGQAVDVVVDELVGTDIHPPAGHPRLAMNIRRVRRTHDSARDGATGR